ncbi:MAG: hypothetical protein JW944_08045 [Deltaproteobacteria bacterium]|nr:hypothetical protein [Deltaproteobacteria bacterium]
MDGHLDEPEWAGAQSYSKFVVIEPMTLATPTYGTEVRVIATEEGLAVAIICEQPSTISRTHTFTSRDAQEFDADNVSVLIDFDGTAKTAYEFSVSITGSYRDGTTNSNAIFSNTDWDGVWQRAVYEEPERWTVEILLPWSIAAMRDNGGKTRKIGMFFKREIQETKQIFGYPAVIQMQPNSMNSFAKVEIPHYTSQQIDVVPYITVLSDRVKDDLEKKAGVDIAWKPSNKFQVVATFNPDFGQVESDQLVINFTAFESFFSDKRPFFTENQAIFDVSMEGGRGGGPGSGGGTQLIYTRRIGGARDDNMEPSRIEGALKVIGSEGIVNYGVLAAKETDEVGKTFYAGRVLIPGNNWSVGVLSTYVDRPYRDRTAVVNSLDYNFGFGKSWRWAGQFMGSNVAVSSDRTTGYAISTSLDYTVSKDEHYSMSISRIDNKFEINDMGFLTRNDIEQFSISENWQVNGFSADTGISSMNWNLSCDLSRNTEGDRFPARINLMGNANMRSGAGAMFGINYSTSGFDDRISRENGLVRINKRMGGNVSYFTQRQGAWKESIGVRVSQEGYEGWGGGFNLDTVWYPTDTLNLNLDIGPNWCRDWLVWVKGTQLGSFSRSQVSGTISANWFPAEGHEFRLKAQWAAVRAEAVQGHHIGEGGRLIPDNEPMNDFAQTNFGLQFRYRYEIGPLSDVYFVYSRGGSKQINNTEQDILELLGDGTNLRNSDQILVKIRYGF